MASKVSGPSKIIADTGTGVHLVGWSHINANDKDKIKCIEDGIILSTANGKINANHRVDVFNEQLREEFEAVVLDKLPPR